MSIILKSDGTTALGTALGDPLADGGGALGAGDVQYIKIMDATIGGTAKAAVGANGLAVDVKASPSTGVIAAAVPASAGFLGLNVGGFLRGWMGALLGTVYAGAVYVVDGAGNQITAFGGTAGAIAAQDHRVSAASNNAASIKGSAGTVYSVTAFNVADYPVFVKFYNKAIAPVVGTDTPVFTIGLQAGVGRNIPFPQGGKAFSIGIAIAIVKGIADLDNTPVLLSDCVVDTLYA